MDHKGEGDANCNLRIQKEAGSVGNWKTKRDNPNYSIIEIRQNIEKSPGNLRKLAVTQTPVKNHHVTLVGKNLQRRK